MKTLEQKRREVGLMDKAGFESGVDACEEMMGELVEALESYKNRISIHRLITPESAEYERTVGLGHIANEALAKYDKWKAKNEA